MSESYQLIDRSRIQVRQDANPRKHFDEEKLKELAESLKTHGMIEPLVVRPMNGAGGKSNGFELISGERRFRAAAIAGIPEVPTIIREIDDQTADEIRLIENLQREDLTAIEEADALKRLHTAHGYSIDQLAERMGKSRRHVYQRLQMAEVCPEARAALQSGKLQPTVATLVARIPDPATQKKYLEAVVKPNWGNEPLTFRAASELLQQEYQISLGKAQFPTKDPELFPPVGSCRECPKNTSNQPGESANVCTDTACFLAKRDAFIERLKARGHQVLDKKTTERCFPYGLHLHDSNFVDVDQPCYADQKHRTWRKILGQEMPLPVITLDNEGRIRFLLNAKDAGEHLKKAQPELTQKIEKEEKYEQDWKRRQAAENRKWAIQKKTIKEGIEKLVEAAEIAWSRPADSLSVLRCLISCLLESSGQTEEIARRRNVMPETKEKAYKAVVKHLSSRYLPNLSYEQLIGLLLELALMKDTQYGQYGHTFVALCQELGIDYKEIEKRIGQEMKKKG